MADTQKRATLQAAVALLPDALSVSRIGLAVVLWFFWRQPMALLAIAVVAAITDMLDGWVARRLRAGQGLMPSVGARGDWLDPLCDKVFVVSWLGATWALLRPPTAIALLLLTREMLLGIFLVAHAILMPNRPVIYRASVAGKLTTGLQFAAVVAMLLDLHGATLPLAALAAVAGTVAAVGYLLRSWRVGGPGVAPSA